MSSQYGLDIPFSTSQEQQGLKLIELPSELLSLLESENPPALTITSSAPNGASPGFALLNTGSKSYQIRQKSTSSPIMIIQPSVTGPTEAEETDTFIPQPSLCSIAKIEDTIEFILQETEGAAKPAPKVNKWHEKFAKGRLEKKT